jgi:type III secretory pathway component EscV
MPHGLTCCAAAAAAAAAGTVLSTLKAFEMFLDLTLAAFLIMGTFVSHKMIVEKMQMKKDRSNVRTDRKDAQKGGSDDDEDSDDEGVPAAVPLKEEKPKVVKAASRSDTLRRRA